MYPVRAGERLAGHAPTTRETVGNPLLLERPKLALFCSVRCPPAKAAAIGPSLKRLRDPGLAVISGFHSPVEKQCLKILLDLQQSVIICLARRLEKIRLPLDWRAPLEQGRLLLLSRFTMQPRRPDRRDAHRRNELVAALADEALIVHAEPGGSIDQVVRLIERWNIPQRQLDA
jgi:predicted Rossmann fold nucleotide-binding protein DprA/Smf involved in DNA uptake